MALPPKALLSRQFLLADAVLLVLEDPKRQTFEQLGLPVLGCLLLSVLDCVLDCASAELSKNRQPGLCRQKGCCHGRLAWPLLRLLCHSSMSYRSYCPSQSYLLWTLWVGMARNIRCP